MTVHDRTLQAQRRNAARQTFRRAALREAGIPLADCDLAYLLTKTREINRCEWSFCGLRRNRMARRAPHI